MKLQTQFRIREKASPRALYRLIRRLAPSAVREDDVWLQATTGQGASLLKILLLVSLCKAAGLKRSRLGDLGTYGYLVIRKYEPEDLAASELLFVHGLPTPTLTTQAKRDDQGRLMVTAREVHHLKDFAEIGHRIILSSAARHALEVAGLHGLVLRQMTLRNKAEADEASEAPCWELATRLTMPKLANTDRLMCYGHDRPEPFTGDYSRMVFLDDPLYAGGEIHYRYEDLMALGSFDIAQTCENLWIPERSFVISQRFYQLLLARGVSLTVEPVRIDR